MTAAVDKEYEAERNRLIDVAAKMADFEVGPKPSTRSKQKTWSERWDRVYHRAMLSLTADPFMIFGAPTVESVQAQKAAAKKTAARLAARAPGSGEVNHHPGFDPGFASDGSGEGDEEWAAEHDAIMYPSLAAEAEEDDKNDDDEEPLAVDEALS